MSIKKYNGSIIKKPGELREIINNLPKTELKGLENVKIFAPSKSQSLLAGGIVLMIFLLTGCEKGVEENPDANVSVIELLTPQPVNTTQINQTSTPPPTISPTSSPSITPTPFYYECDFDELLEVDPNLYRDNLIKLMNEENDAGAAYLLIKHNKSEKIILDEVDFMRANDILTAFCGFGKEYNESYPEILYHYFSQDGYEWATDYKGPGIYICGGLQNLAVANANCFAFMDPDIRKISLDINRQLEEFAKNANGNIFSNLTMIFLDSNIDDKIKTYFLPKMTSGIYSLMRKNETVDIDFVYKNSNGDITINIDDFTTLVMNSDTVAQFPEFKAGYEVFERSFYFADHPDEILQGTKK